jgi:cytochrome oxidase assembly protein ShyY1
VTLGTAAQPNTGRAPRSPLVLFAVFAAALVLFSTFVALGTWQIHRRSWKLDLIARVNQRVHAPPVAAPREPNWPAVTAANSEYLHVRADGIFLNDRETLVQATTELGAGYWVLTPLRLSDGSIVLVNRGFVPPERRDRAAHSAAAPTTPATVTGFGGIRVTFRPSPLRAACAMSLPISLTRKLNPSAPAPHEPQPIPLFRPARPRATASSPSQA